MTGLKGSPSMDGSQRTLSLPIGGKEAQAVVIPAYDDRDLLDAIWVVDDLLNMRAQSHCACHPACVFKVARPVDDHGFGIIEAIRILPRHYVEARFPQITPHLFRDAGNAAPVEYFDADSPHRIRTGFCNRLRFRYGERCRRRCGGAFRHWIDGRGLGGQPSLDVEDGDRCKGQNRQSGQDDFS